MLPWADLLAPRPQAQPAAARASRDVTAPQPVLTPGSSLRSAGRTGTVRLRIAIDEPGAVLVSGRVRVIAAKRDRAKSRPASRLFDVPPTLVRYSRAGTKTATIELPAAARRQLATSRRARFSLQVIAADTARNATTRRTAFQLTS